MQLDLVHDTWQEIKKYINPTDKMDAINDLISTLIDHDVDPSDIAERFGGDRQVMSVLNEYLEKDSDEDQDEFYQDDDDDEDWNDRD